ncbi:polysaccharide deacetylase [Hoeflea prorocentri]|uniref:Polysaccharide deacetylase n=1 Tax=Hoeflea prorocentri TaxID=1922333 RepID=A0A9X3UJI1_9HYPH|nr:polysaccharide deacetylase [Hoeflea prorocentri]MCY6381731.1 polysaccharide deacetylase [Hoeflea prorocentri]MDA5399531.1 polysaccharide deacetylase [Hoeflea prorocentri]
MPRLCKTTALSVFAALIATPALPTQQQQPQIVIVSFDGAHDNALWAKSREIGERTGATFTYFLSCTFLMTRSQRWSYRAPDNKSGRSNVGFADSPAEVRARLGHIWSARNEGHEIASHACGHFDGGEWSENDWKVELAAFSSTLENAWANADAKGEEPEGWRQFVRTDINGFRAPYLSTSSGLTPALKSAGYTYDASGISRGPKAPRRGKGLSAFDLPLIPEGPQNRRIIAMDYNMFVRHSAGVEDASNSQYYEERAYSAFRTAFDREYDGSRQPFQIGLHFVEMNGGAYWRATERLLSDVCGREDVACVSYEMALDMLDKAKKGGGA